MHFKQTDQGHLVGYHWEGCETFQLAGAVRLSMESLDNARPLFVAHVPDGGWESGRLYEITFKPLKKFEAADAAEFDQLLHHSDRGGWAASPLLIDLAAQGHRLFCLNDAPKWDAEAFIWQPKEAVISIRDITVDYTVPGITKLFKAINN